jgi:hypothetical protein
VKLLLADMLLCPANDVKLETDTEQKAVRASDQETVLDRRLVLWRASPRQTTIFASSTRKNLSLEAVARTIDKFPDSDISNDFLTSSYSYPRQKATI